MHPITEVEETVSSSDYSATGNATVNDEPLHGKMYDTAPTDCLSEAQEKISDPERRVDIYPETIAVNQQAVPNIMSPASSEIKQVDKDLERMKAATAISKLLESTLPWNLPERIFVVTEVSNPVQLSEPHYLPVEIGMTAFSLNCGIVGNYSALLPAGELPATKPNEDRAIQFPVYEKKLGNYGLIWENITRFMAQSEPSATFHFVFCKDRNVAEVKTIFEVISSKLDAEMNIDVLPLGLLHQKLDYLGGKLFRLKSHPELYASWKFSEEAKFFATGGRGHADGAPRCFDAIFNFNSHKCIQNILDSGSQKPCPLERAQKSAFSFMGYHIEYFGIKSVEGVHYPLMQKAEPGLPKIQNGMEKLSLSKVAKIEASATGGGQKKETPQNAAWKTIEIEDLKV